MFDETKPQWLSKTIIGAFVVVLAIVLGAFGITIDAEEQVWLVDQIYALVSAGLALVGAALAYYGRRKANTRIE